MPATLRVATRGSALALWQARRVIELLGVEAELVIVSTQGDSAPEIPVWSMGGTGVFVAEVSDAVLSGRAEIAVHAAKDLPSTSTEGMVIAAVPERGDVRDALVGSRLDAVPIGGSVGTGSVRRMAQLLHLRPDLTFGSLRGNIATRLDRAADFDAIVVANAALIRLDCADRATEVLEPEVMIPQVGQGAIAVECLASDPVHRALLSTIDDRVAHGTLLAERGFLSSIGSGCDLPVGALASKPIDSNGDPKLGWDISGFVSSHDGSAVIRSSAHHVDSVTAGRNLATQILDELGGRELLAKSVRREISR